MNDTNRTGSPLDQDGEKEPGRGSNLTVIYSLILLAMLAAVAIAIFIVLPFYHRH